MNSKWVNSLLLLLLCNVIVAEECKAKSVYAIINHEQDLIGAYKIQGDQIDHQITHQAPTHGARVVDIAVDPSSNYLFVTYETFPPYDVVIELINAKTMTNEGPVPAPGANNLAGLAIEQRDNLVRLFTVDRGSNHLYVYHWDAEEKELTLEGGTYKELDYGGAMGISLDNVNHVLYVTNASNIVHYYDTDTWTHQGSIDVGRIAYDIEVDAERKYLYTGGYYTHDYLVQTWIGPDDPNDPGDPNICLTLTVRVNGYAEPLGEFENFVEIESDNSYNTATETTPVCC